MHYRSDTEEQFKPVSFTLCIHFYSCPASSNYAYSSAYFKKTLIIIVRRCHFDRLCTIPPAFHFFSLLYFRKRANVKKRKHSAPQILFLFKYRKRAAEHTEGFVCCEFANRFLITRRSNFYTCNIFSQYEQRLGEIPRFRPTLMVCR
jgi:hypothetical protein